MSDELSTRKIVGAATEERVCPSCGGKGRVKGVRLIGEYCPAVLDTGHEELSCMVKGFHPGPHKTYMEKPCLECGGMDLHTEWCSQPDPQRGDFEPSGLDVQFDDDGWYWHEKWVQA